MLGIEPSQEVRVVDVEDGGFHTHCLLGLTFTQELDAEHLSRSFSGQFESHGAGM